MKLRIIIFAVICAVMGEDLEDEVGFEEAEERAGGGCTYGYLKDQKNVLPDQWGEVNATCDGTVQSPIDLKDAVDMTCLDFVFTGYDEKLEGLTMTNTGSTVQFTFTNNPAPTVSGGCLPGTYTIAQFHYHWGGKGGSEHKIEGKKTEMELHLVHYNSDNYGSVGEAADALSDPEALAVLGVMIDRKKKSQKATGGFPNNKIASALKNITKSGKDTTLDITLTLEDLLPEKKSFYRYMGSLTTPPCSEIVVWTVFAQKKIVRPYQLKNFKKNLKFCKGAAEKKSKYMKKNWRPLQALNGRTVKYVKKN